MPIVPRITPEQALLLNRELDKIKDTIQELYIFPAPVFLVNDDTGPEACQSAMLMIAEIRGLANRISGDTFSLMEAMRTCWQRNYTQTPVVKPAPRSTTDDLIF